MKIPPIKTNDYPSRALMRVAHLQQGEGSNLIVRLYNEYKKDIPKKYRINTSSKISSVFSSVLKTISDLILEADAGLILNKFGYFYVAKSIKPYIKVYTRKDGTQELSYNLSGDLRNNTIMFIPNIKRNSDFFGWSMDYSSHTSSRKYIKDKIVNKNKRYKGYPYTFKQLKLI